MQKNLSEPVIIGCDHAALRLKGVVKAHLQKQGMDVEDVGTHSEDSVDYPAYGIKVAKQVGNGSYARGILLCGTGLGMSMVANRFANVRAALCCEPFSAAMSRKHNDANILVLGGRIVGDIMALEIVDAWLQTPFEGGRHQNRLNMFNPNIS